MFSDKFNTLPECYFHFHVHLWQDLREISYNKLEMQYERCRSRQEKHNRVMIPTKKKYWRLLVFF